MLKNIIITVIYLIFASLLFGTLIGCGPKIPSACQTTQVVATTPAQVVTKIVEKNNWLITLGILGVGLSVFAIVSGNTKFGFAGAISSGVIILTSLSIARYFSTIAFIGVVLGVILAGAALFYILAIKTKALHEIVGGIQTFKPVLGALSKEHLTTTFNSTQSPSTQSLVKQIKENIGG